MLAALQARPMAIHLQVENSTAAGLKACGPEGVIDSGCAVDNAQALRSQVQILRFALAASRSHGLVNEAYATRVCKQTLFFVLVIANAGIQLVNAG
jgi:hypothetical protein